MKKKMSYELSDGLKALRRSLSDFDHCGLIMEGEQIDATKTLLAYFEELAKQLENEVSRHRWNEDGRADLRRLVEQGDMVVAAASQPGSNVRLFSPPARPFSDGRARP